MSSRIAITALAFVASALLTGNSLQVLSAEQPMLAQQGLDAELNARELELSINLVRALRGGYERSTAIARVSSQ